MQTSNLFILKTEILNIKNSLLPNYFTRTCVLEVIYIYYTAGLPYSQVQTCEPPRIKNI